MFIIPIFCHKRATKMCMPKIYQCHLYYNEMQTQKQTAPCAYRISKGYTGSQSILEMLLKCDNANQRNRKHSTHEFPISSIMQKLNKKQITSVAPLHCNVYTMFLQTAWSSSHWSQKKKKAPLSPVGIVIKSVQMHADIYKNIFEYLNYSSQNGKILTRQHLSVLLITSCTAQIERTSYLLFTT